MQIKSGAKGSKIELFWGGFNYFNKKLFPRINIIPENNLWSREE